MSSDREPAPAHADHQPRPYTGKSVRLYLDKKIAERKARQKKLHKKRRKRDRSTPPLPTFDFAMLADSTALTERECASVLRRSLSCLQNWRLDPEHPLKWERIAGRVIYTAGNIRDFRKATTTSK
jgi:hypothetical protein